MELDDAIEHMLSEEAKQRVKIVAALRHLTTDPKHLELLHNYKPLNSMEGLPLLTISDPVEDSSTLARAAYELLFDFGSASRLCASRLELEQSEAYNFLASKFGQDYEARFEFETWEARQQQKYEAARRA